MENPDEMSGCTLKLFENSLWFDAVIHVQGTVFKVHKAVLAARCPVFWVMFKPDMKMKKQIENVIQIGDIRPEVFREVLRYIYTGEIERNDETVLEIWIAADRFQINTLKRKVLYFIKSNLADVMKSKIWNEILYSHVELLTEIMQLYISE